MSQEMIMELAQHIFYTTFIVIAPILGAAMVVGVLISIFQAVTNIQEQTLVFIPKIFAVMLILFLIFPWIIQTMIQFTTLFFEYALTISR